MNQNNDFSNQSNESRIAPRDTLADRLRGEAMAERPEFSPELHNQILDRVRQTDQAVTLPDGMGDRRWRSIAAAAVIAAAFGLTALWIEHSHRSPTRNNSLPVVDRLPLLLPNAIPTAIVAEVPRASFAVNIGGVFSARIWPPQIIVNLPIAQSLAPRLQEPLSIQSAPATGLPGSPEWLLARLQEPASSAQAALVDVIPPEVRILFH
jgi:hypothetical protein